MRNLEKRKNEIAINLLQLLINNHDDGDSLVRESHLIKYSHEKDSYTPDTNEISESVNLINACVNEKVVSEGWIPIGGLLSTTYESSYLTDYSVSILTKIIEILNVSVKNDENENSEFEELIKFQQTWNSISMVDKQQIARETDRVNNMGVECYNQDNFADAIKYFKMAVKIMPMNDDALKNLIICYKYTGELDKIPALSRMLAYLEG